jgi:hypothetical protein
VAANGPEIEAKTSPQVYPIQPPETLPECRYGQKFFRRAGFSSIMKYKKREFLKR